ncbi:uncharacterized protein METZ01_LOCUS341614, partial [marine metagenome]
PSSSWPTLLQEITSGKYGSYILRRAHERFMATLIKPSSYSRHYQQKMHVKRQQCTWMGYRSCDLNGPWQKNAVPNTG